MVNLKFGIPIIEGIRIQIHSIMEGRNFRSVAGVYHSLLSIGNVSTVRGQKLHAQMVFQKIQNTVNGSTVAAAADQQGITFVFHHEAIGTQSPGIRCHPGRFQKIGAAHRDHFAVGIFTVGSIGHTHACDLLYIGDKLLGCVLFALRCQRGNHNGILCRISQSHTKINSLGSGGSGNIGIYRFRVSCHLLCRILTAASHAHRHQKRTAKDESQELIHFSHTQPSTITV